MFTVAVGVFTLANKNLFNMSRDMAFLLIGWRNKLDGTRKQTDKNIIVKIGNVKTLIKDIN